MTASNLTLSQVLRTAIERGTASIRVGLPGRVESFDPVTQTASVKPLLKEIATDAAGEELSESLPVINKVPVQFIGGGDYALTMPVKAGDPCWLSFSDRSLDQWFAAGSEVDPVVLDRHALTDAVAFLGVRSQPGKLADFDPSRAVFGNHGPRVAVDGSAVHLGVDHQESGSQDSIRGTAYRASEDTLVTAVGSGAETAGTAIQAAATALTTAIPLLAVPIVGGSLAAASLTSAAVALQAAAAGLKTIQPAGVSFKASGPDYLQPKVKLP